MANLSLHDLDNCNQTHVQHQSHSLTEPNVTNNQLGYLKKKEWNGS